MTSDAACEVDCLFARGTVSQRQKVEFCIVVALDVEAMARAPITNPANEAQLETRMSARRSLPTYSRAYTPLPLYTYGRKEVSARP